MVDPCYGKVYVIRKDLNPNSFYGALSGVTRAIGERFPTLERGTLVILSTYEYKTDRNISYSNHGYGVVVEHLGNKTEILYAEFDVIYGKYTGIRVNLELPGLVEDWFKEVDIETAKVLYGKASS